MPVSSFQQVGREAHRGKRDLVKRQKRPTNDTQQVGREAFHLMVRLLAISCAAPCAQVRGQEADGK
jgi:hypothetical protein